MTTRATRVVTHNPYDRYAIVGKSRSGKTSYGVVLAAKIVPHQKAQAQGWECWWQDTKNDKRDIDRLHRWGFTDGFKGSSPRKLITVPFEQGKPSATVDAVNEICYRALKQHGVVLVVDEYRHVCASTRMASPGILHAHQRGAGRDVGIIGMTQEPVEIPRQLLSQAAHIYLFDLTYPYDIKYAHTLNKHYRPPRRTFGDPHGFYHGWIDGDGEWTYYRNQQEWSERTSGLVVPD